MSENKTKRRDFLFTATYAVGAVGVGATIWLVYKGPLDGWVSVGHDGTAYPYA